ncbi:hypothetical protein [Peptostreptococcus russellii]|uniref:hypothetical protein n=1 Tax=Peptostreptococcus russellii TaxID=215200 RepID=UPI003F588534
MYNIGDIVVLKSESGSKLERRVMDKKDGKYLLWGCYSFMGEHMINHELSSKINK